MTDITEQELQSLRNLGNEYERAADEIEHLRARVDELHSQPCSDCGAPSEPATLCSSCATSRCIELGIMAAAEQRKRDAEICRQIHSTSRQRVELALLCAREIEGAGQ